MPRWVVFVHSYGRTISGRPSGTFLKHDTSVHLVKKSRFGPLLMNLYASRDNLTHMSHRITCLTLIGHTMINILDANCHKLNKPVV